MTTLAQVKKVAKQTLIPEMEALGFIFHSGLDFSRKYGEGIYQLVCGGITRGGVLTFSATCFVPEHDQDCMKNFPKYVPILSGGQLGEKFIFGGWWEIDAEEDIKPALEGVYQNVLKYALPWFDTVKTRQDYVDNLYDHIREELEQEGNIELVLHPNKYL